MLYFVSTPVGNLKDISLRALEVLKSVDVIACEDTRTSLKLLNHYEIKKPLVAYHKFNETVAAEKIIRDLKDGKNVALITGAGTPVRFRPGQRAYEIISGLNLKFPKKSAYFADQLRFLKKLIINQRRLAELKATPDGQ